MFRLDWLQAGGATRGTPRRDQTRRRRWPVLGLLACVVLLQSGCQSGPFSHCGDGSGLFSPCGFFGRVSSRVFNRSNGGCCGPGVVSGGVVEGAPPSTVVAPRGGSRRIPSGRDRPRRRPTPRPGRATRPELSPVQDAAPKSRVGAAARRQWRHEPRVPSPRRAIKPVAPAPEPGSRGDKTKTCRRRRSRRLSRPRGRPRRSRARRTRFARVRRSRSPGSPASSRLAG